MPSLHSLFDKPANYTPSAPLVGYILPILNSSSTSFRIVFEQYSPTSARPSTGRNDLALFEYKQVTEALEKSGKDATVSKVTDFQEIAKLGIFSTPALVIDGEVKCVGQVPGEKDLLVLLGN